MPMPAGTIAFTNGSTAVTGTDTTFTTDVTATDFIVVVIGGTSYMIGVTSVETDTGLTLVRNFDGPTTDGLTYRVVPVQTMQLITSQLSADTARAFRGFNLDKSNWQQVFSGTGNITVNLPDGTSYTGPAWNSFTASLSEKAAKGVNSDITSLAGLTTPLSLSQGGTGGGTAATARTGLGLKGAAILDVGTAAGTVAAGNDSRFSTVNGKTGGAVTSSIVVGTGYSAGIAARTTTEDNSTYLTNLSASVATGQYVNFTHYSWYAGFVRTGIRRGSGTNVDRYSVSMSVNDSAATSREWSFNADGTATGPGAWNTGSDERHKFDLTEIDDALGKIADLRCVTYSAWDSDVRHVGLIAQDVGSICPEAITKSSEPIKFSGDREIDSFQYLDISGFTAAYAFKAIKELHAMVNSQSEQIDELKAMLISGS